VPRGLNVTAYCPTACEPRCCGSPSSIQVTDGAQMVRAHVETARHELCPQRLKCGFGQGPKLFQVLAQCVFGVTYVRSVPDRTRPTCRCGRSSLQHLGVTRRQQLADGCELLLPVIADATRLALIAGSSWCVPRLTSEEE